MNLSFSRKIKKENTYFPEKIIRGLELLEYKKMTLLDFLYEVTPESEWMDITDFQKLTPKITTLREDKKDRWKSGNDIHFVINNRTPQRFKFAPVVKCVSTQNVSVTNNPKNGRYITIREDNESRILCPEKEKLVAINDGFHSVDDFYSWFNQDWNGKIIHWTNLKY